MMLFKNVSIKIGLRLQNYEYLKRTQKFNRYHSQTNRAILHEHMRPRAHTHTHTHTN